MGLTNPSKFFDQEKSISNYDSVEITESESNKKEIRNNEIKQAIRSVFLELFVHIILDD